MAEIKVGTTARLNSGGPIMTCIRTSDTKEGYYDWAYFNKGCAEVLLINCVHPDCVTVVPVEMENNKNYPDPPPYPKPRVTGNF